MGFDVSKKEVINLIRKYTPDATAGSEYISKENFERLLEHKLGTRDPEQELRTAFELFDTE
ncbi:Calcium-binding component of the spindle pole body (SPB) half-bridge, partial [Massospora cicadina]